jgi:hypothetical protein
MSELITKIKDFEVVFGRTVKLSVYSDESGRLEVFTGISYAYIASFETLAEFMSMDPLKIAESGNWVRRMEA